MISKKTKAVTTLRKQTQVNLIVHFSYSLRIKGSIPMKLKCAECHCAPQECAKQSNLQCKTCTKNDCCCVSFHQQPTHFSSVFGYLGHLKGLYAAALGIEILCITASELGENAGLFVGFNPLGIAIINCSRVLED
jgi:hypothetical protein